MMSKQDIQQLIKQAVNEKLSGNKSVAQEVAKQEEEIVVKEQEAPQPIIKSLDESDAIKLENLLLKQQVEKLQQEYENLRREYAEKDIQLERVNLQKFLVEKYEVDTSQNQLVINASQRTLTITPHVDPQH
jgi:predicted lipid-binding transport protein (Tim44 family)